MAAENLKVEIRSEFGKGSARRLRAEEKVPAVLYGHASEPKHLILPRHAAALIARNSNALIELEIPNAKNELAIIKDVQRHPLSRFIQHIDLLLVKRGEKVEVEIPLTVEGEPVSPAVPVVGLQWVMISADATNIPEQVVVNVDDMEDGTQVFAGDLKLGDGVELVTDAELLAVSVEVPHVDESDLEAPSSDDEEGEGAEAAQ